jgi:hypothetical protein
MDGSAIRRLPPEEDIEESGLPGARPPHEADDLTWAE